MGRNGSGLHLGFRHPPIPKVLILLIDWFLAEWPSASRILNAFAFGFLLKEKGTFPFLFFVERKRARKRLLYEEGLFPLILKLCKIEDYLT